MKRRTTFDNIIILFLITVLIDLNIDNFTHQENFYLGTSDINGNDDRVRITPTTDYPWSAIVKLHITWDGQSTLGSGAMIDKNHVLTAGHCVYSQSQGGWADSIKIVPGADNGNEPFGHAWATNMRCYSR